MHLLCLPAFPGGNCRQLLLRGQAVTLFTAVYSSYKGAYKTGYQFVYIREMCVCRLKTQVRPHINPINLALLTSIAICMKIKCHINKLMKTHNNSKIIENISYIAYIRKTCVWVGEWLSGYVVGKVRERIGNFITSYSIISLYRPSVSFFSFH